MSAEALLDRLQGARRTGVDRWVARCPAHEDRRASLSIREVDDGRVLLHCFAGCEAEQILSAVGLDFEALFPPRAAADRVKPTKRPWRIGEVVRALEFELTVAFIFLGDVANGRPITDTDRARAAECQERIARFLDEVRNAA